MRILVLEDEKPLREALEDKLKREGFDVKSVENGAEACKIALKEEFDVWLLDVITPKMNGLEMVLKTKEQVNYKPKIVILSNVNEKRHIEMAMNMGVDEYFVKSDTPLKQVVSELKRLCSKK